MTQVIHEPGREVVALAVDRAGGQPERVVLDVRQVVRRQPADAARLIHLVRPDVQSVRALETILADDAPEARERIAHLREHAVRPLFEQRVEVALVKQAALAERTHPPVDAARLVQVERGPADVVHEAPEPGALERRQREKDLMIGQEIAEHEHRPLRRTQTRRDGGIARGEVEAEFPLVGSAVRARVLRVRQLTPGPRRRRQAVGGGVRERERARRFVQRRREVDTEREIGKSAEQQTAVRARHELRIERPIQRSRFSAPCPRRIDRVHLERAVAIRREIDAPSAPARRLVAPVPVREVTDHAAREIEREQIARPTLAEGRTVGRKDDGLPVGADGRIEVLVAIGGEPLQASRAQRIPRIGEPQAIEIGVARDREAAEHDALGIGRPGRRENRHELRKLIAADDLAFLQIPEEQRVPLGVLAAERRDAVRAHVDAGLEEVKGFELLAALPLYHRPASPPTQVLRVDRRVAARGREEQE